MKPDKAKEEVVSVFEKIKPNEVVTLSPEAGKLLLDTIRKLEVEGRL